MELADRPPNKSPEHQLLYFFSSMDICGLALTQKAPNENERHAIQPPPKGKATGPATVPLGNVSCGWMAVGTGTA